MRSVGRGRFGANERISCSEPLGRLRRPEPTGIGAKQRLSEQVGVVSALLDGVEPEDRAGLSLLVRDVDISPGVSSFSRPVPHAAAALFSIDVNAPPTLMEVETVDE